MWMHQLGRSFIKELFSRIQPSTYAGQLSGLKALPYLTISSTISSTMAFNVAKIASARASLTISLTISLRVAGPLVIHAKMARWRHF